ARSVVHTVTFPEHHPRAGDNLLHVERLLKFLLWANGGSRIRISGAPELVPELQKQYSPGGARAFDAETVSRRMFGEDLVIEAVETAPDPIEPRVALGRHLTGCRIGFDLGGSDRKCAAVIDGDVVFSEEIPWDPYFQSDPDYHLEGIRDSLNRAAAHLPRVDAIGGSAAGIYRNNEVRVASLFRGIPDDLFDERVRPIFLQLRKEWNGIPFDVVNDGEVTALAASMSLNDQAVLGISMGTSLAAGYVDAHGHITPRLNELAFCPIDLRADAPVDEWSGDGGCGVQYFSQQGVARLVPAAGIDLPADMSFPEQLVDVQNLMQEGDHRAAALFRTIGVCFGYAIAHYADFYDIRHLLILGR
ncbi:MAG: ROK family protein, partial [Verrucomicrobiota bacterium]